MIDKVVLHFQDGRISKGYLLRDLNEESGFVEFNEIGSDDPVKVNTEELKAVFFVRDFMGNPDYKEQRRYGISEKIGRRVYIKFKDGEVMLGYLLGKLPWKKGFFLNGDKGNKTGFFIVPVDRESNNLKIFVVAEAVKDMTVL